MNKSRKRMRSVMLLTTVALAGSAGATFNFSFGASGGEARPPQEGTKSDAGTTSGNHASVRVTGIMGIRYAYLWVGTYSSASNKGYTSTKYVDSTGLSELNYTTAVTNGTLYLHATTPNVGGGGMGGTWYP